MTDSIPSLITKEFLDKNPEYIFVFGDNNLRKGKGGAAILRDHPNSYGFITKKEPNNNPSSFYTLTNYPPVLAIELVKLKKLIRDNPDKIFLISKLGAGLANKHGIYEAFIRDALLRLKTTFFNVVLLG